MTRLLIPSLALLCLLAGCQDGTTCICTPVDDFTRTVEVPTEGSCESLAEAESNLYSSCIESSESVAPFGPTIALRVLADPVWEAPWPHNGSLLPRPRLIGLADQ